MYIWEAEARKIIAFRDSVLAKVEHTRLLDLDPKELPEALANLQARYRRYKIENRLVSVSKSNGVKLDAENHGYWHLVDEPRLKELFDAVEKNSTSAVLKGRRPSVSSGNGAFSESIPLKRPAVFLAGQGQGLSYDEPSMDSEGPRPITREHKEDVQAKAISVKKEMEKKEEREEKVYGEGEEEEERKEEDKEHKEREEEHDDSEDEYEHSEQEQDNTQPENLRGPSPGAGGFALFSDESPNNPAQVTARPSEWSQQEQDDPTNANSYVPPTYLTLKRQRKKVRKSNYADFTNRHPFYQPVYQQPPVPPIPAMHPPPPPLQPPRPSPRTAYTPYPPHYSSVPPWNAQPVVYGPPVTAPLPPAPLMHYPSQSEAANVQFQLQNAYNPVFPSFYGTAAPKGSQSSNRSTRKRWAPEHPQQAYSNRPGRKLQPYDDYGSTPAYSDETN